MADSDQQIQQVVDTLGSARYFYGLRRTDAGELYMSKVDLMGTSAGDALEINRPGNASANYPHFSRGVDFFEGRDIQHTKIYDNLNYEQFRWDARNIFYYISTDGELVLRVNQDYTYPVGI